MTTRKPQRHCAQCRRAIDARGKSGLCRPCLNTSSVLMARWKQGRTIHVQVFTNGRLTNELTDNGENTPIILNIGAVKAVITRGKKGATI